MKYILTPTFTEKNVFFCTSLFVCLRDISAQHHFFTVMLCILYCLQHVHAVDEKNTLFKVQGIKAKTNQLQHGQWHQARFISTSESGLKKRVWEDEGIEVPVSVGFLITMKNIHVGLMIFLGFPLGKVPVQWISV